MTLKEALIALAEGKAVRSVVWKPHLFLYLENGILLNQMRIREHSIPCEYDDWELYEEPKKKKIVWEWLVEGLDYASPRFVCDELMTEAEAKEQWPKAKLTPLRSFEVEE